MDESDPNYDITKDPNRKAKSTDPGWKYAYWPDLNDKNLVACGLCHKTFRAGIKRLKQHLVGKYGDAVKCTKTTTRIAKEMEAALKAGQRNKRITFDDDEEIVSHASSNSVGSSQFIDVVSEESEKYPSSGTSIKKRKALFQFPPPKPASKSPSHTPSIDARLRRSPEEVVDERRRGGFSQTTIENRMRTKDEREKVCDHIADWFYEHAISFNAASSRSFEIMIESIAQYGSGFKPPTPHEIRTTFLDRAKKKTEETRKHHEVAWKEYGCTLMSDGWTDRRNRHLINFCVNSPVGTYFMGSVDASNQSQDASMLADLLGKKVEEIGPENVVQVCTDNASNYKAAGKILEARWKTLFWTPCAAHCLDLMLEDIGNMKEFKAAILKGRGITTFIYRHGRILSAMREKTGGKDLVRTGVTRFATAFLTLQSLLKHKDDLRSLFLDDTWRKCKQSRTEAGKKVADTVCSVQFWNKVQDCIKASQPLLKALRIVDGDERPALAEIYPAMDYAKEVIKQRFEKNQALGKKIMQIIENRWECQMQQQLYGAAYFLNPGKYFEFKEKDPDGASNLRLDFNDVLTKMIPDQNMQDKISIFADAYDGSREDFGREMAIRQRTLKNPLDWWTSFGGRARELSKFARRILGLCCSASGCERNWSTFEFVHSKRRNRLQHQRLNDLLFVQYNRKLLARMKKRNEVGRNYDPLQLDEINWESEWVVDNPSQELVHPGEDLTYEQVDIAMGASVWSEGRQLPRRVARNRRGPSGSRSNNHSLMDEDEEIREEVEDEEHEQALPLDDLDVEDDYGMAIEPELVESQPSGSGGGGRDDDELLDLFET